MAQLIEFTNHHLALVGAFVAVLAALLASLRQGGGLAISSARAVQLLNQQDAVAVDIRSEKSFRAGHIINAVHATPEEITAGAEKLARYRERPVIVYCDRGLTSVASAKALRRAGFPQAWSLQGGVEGWRHDGLPLRGSR